MVTYPIKIMTSLIELDKALIETAQMYHQVLLVTDSSIYRIYQDLLEGFKQQGIKVHVVPKGESSKSQVELFRLLSTLATEGFTRKDLLIAFGGGVVGDLTGFAASIYMRGIDWISVPTTLLAQVDSSIGGKTAINLEQGKNLVGSFYNPKAVLISTSVLQTLSQTELLSGIGELIKYAYLSDYAMLESVLLAFKYWKQNDENVNFVLEKLIKQALEIKRVVVEKDYREAYERKFLNLGHSIGHAIEALENYQIPHGICVAHGIWWMLKLEALQSVDSKKDDANAGILTYEVLLDELEIERPKIYNIDALMSYLVKDKKMAGDAIELVRINVIDKNHDLQHDILSSIMAQCRIESIETAVLREYLKTIGQGN